MKKVRIVGWTAGAIVSVLIALHAGKAQAGVKVVQSHPTEIRVTESPIPIGVRAQSPAETETELQVICLFHSDASNALHGSLVELNEKLKGLLDRVRTENLFRGDVGETLLLQPAAGTVGAKRLLIIGLGDAKTFSPERMEGIGAIVYQEATQLGVAHPFFAPTVLDGGVTAFGTGEVAEQVIRGFLRGLRTEKALVDAGVSTGPVVRELTYLAGIKHAEDTQHGIERAVAAGR